MKHVSLLKFDEAARNHQRPEGKDVLTSAPVQAGLFHVLVDLHVASGFDAAAAFGLEARVVHAVPVLAEESELALKNRRWLTKLDPSGLFDPAGSTRQPRKIGAR